MAEVWMGRRAAIGGASKAVAIKLLARDMLDDPAYRDMFMAEARLSMLLTHSNVVQVFDVGEKKGEIYMVMEWIDGMNLADLRRKMTPEGERLDVAMAAYITGEVLRGLAYAHGLHHDGAAATIVHRDVSPQNVLLSVSGEVKLADFGVARLAREETSGMHVKGKLRYMAPEQLRGRSREPTVDLYAVGAILHEMLVGHKFRQTSDQADIYSLVLSGEYEPLPDDTPAALRATCEGLLEPDPKRRLASAEAALEQLLAWPGYRNRSIELARAIRRWVGVRAPRSGIVNTDVAKKAVDTAARTTARDRDQGKELEEQSTREHGEGTHAEPTQELAKEASSGAEAAEVEVTDKLPPEDTSTDPDEPTEVDHPAESPDTRTWVGSASGSGPETVAAIPRAASASSGGAAGQGGQGKLVAVMGAAVVLALAFGVVGLGFGLGWWGAPAPEEPVAASADVAGEDSSEALAVAGSTNSQDAIADETEEEGPSETGSSTETETETSSDTGSESGTEDGSEADSESESDTGSPEAPKDTRPRTIVVRAGKHGWGVFRAPRKGSQTIEPNGEVKLPPGEYTFRFDPKKSGKWLKCSKEVGTAKRYELRWLDKGCSLKRM
ncbi:serine/threonine protein kinase [Plesiocystis pacifica SIR-1]|uniref:non-specific serine/threonine protein kinase n=2 Tax=Plesiocystis pacifica TaxID=191768 RepID=A6G006_9BACT|nr:serine/threonine protein kinase [Plesiocystis pacifica SIR-1]